MKRSKLLIPVLSTAIIGSSVVLPLVSCGDKTKAYNLSIAVIGDGSDVITWKVKGNVVGKGVIISIKNVYGELIVDDSVINFDKESIPFDDSWKSERDDGCEIAIPYKILEKATGKIEIKLYARQTLYRVKFDKDDHTMVALDNNTLEQDLSYALSTDSPKYQIDTDSIRVSVNGQDKTSSLQIGQTNPTTISLKLPSSCITDKSDNIVFTVRTKDRGAIEQYNITVSTLPATGGGSYNIRSCDIGEDVVIEWNHDEGVEFDKDNSSLLINNIEKKDVLTYEEKSKQTIFTIAKGALSGITKDVPIDLKIGWKYKTYNLVSPQFGEEYAEYGVIDAGEIVNVYGKNIQIPFRITNEAYDYDDDATEVSIDSEGVEFGFEQIAKNQYKLIIDTTGVSTIEPIEVTIALKQVKYFTYVKKGDDGDDLEINVFELQNNVVEQDLQWKLSLRAGRVLKTAKYKIGDAGETKDAEYDSDTQIISIPKAQLTGVSNETINLTITCVDDTSENVAFRLDQTNSMEMKQYLDTSTGEIKATHNSGQFTANFELAQASNDAKQISLEIVNWSAEEEKKPTIDWELSAYDQETNVSYFKVFLTWGTEENDPEIGTDVTFGIKISIGSEKEITIPGFTVKGKTEYEINESWYENPVFEAEAKSKIIGQNVVYCFKFKEDSQQDVIEFVPKVNNKIVEWNHEFDPASNSMTVTIGAGVLNKWKPLDLFISTSYNKKLINFKKETISEKPYGVASSDAFVVQSKPKEKDVDINNIYGTIELSGAFEGFAKCQELYIGIKDASKFGSNFPLGCDCIINYIPIKDWDNPLVIEPLPSDHPLYSAGYRIRIVLDNKVMPGSRISFILNSKEPFLEDEITTAFMVAGLLG